MVDLLERRCPTCGPTTAEPHPNQPGVIRCANCKEHHRSRPLPIDRLRILIDRACRHLTPAEGTALREALAGTVHNATTAVQGLHQRAADAEARAEGAEQQLATVRALHQPEKTMAGTTCTGCLVGDPFEAHPWPCPTIAALDAPAGPECTDPPRCDNCHETPCPDWCDGPHHYTETPR